MTETTTPDIDKLKDTLELYQDASQLVARADFPGYQCESVFRVLKFFQDICRGLEKDILAIDPKAFDKTEDT